MRLGDFVTIFRISHYYVQYVLLKCLSSRYIPPITGDGPGGSQARPLPEAPAEIEEEIRKQESLLSDLHLQISSGAATKKVEEQVWEQQRIVTQLKRKLRMAKHHSDGQLNLDEGGGGGGGGAKSKFEPIEYEEEINFSLQTPKKPEEPQKRQAQQQQQRHQEKEQQHLQQQQQQQLRPEKESPPEETAEDTEHKVTVMVHQSDVESKKGAAPPPSASSSSDATDSKGHVTVIKLQESKEEVVTAREESPQNSKAPPAASASKDEGAPPAKKEKFPLLPPPPASHKMRQGNAVLLRPTPASPMHVKLQQQQQSAKQQQPQQQQQQHFHSSLSVDRGVDLAKSKSLPRGLPSDGSAFDMFAAEAATPATAAVSASAAAPAVTAPAPVAGPQSLNPFPSDEAIRREREQREAKGL